MNPMTSRQRMLTALQCQKPDQVPVFDWFTVDSRKRIINALQIKNPEDEVEFAQAVGFDAISYGAMEGQFMATAFCEVLYDEVGGEHLQSDGLINSREDLHKVRLPDVSDPNYFDDAKRYVDRYGKSDLAIFFMMRTGIMNTMYSLGFNNFCLKIFDDVKLIQAVLDMYSEWNLRVLEKAQDLGFDFVFACDDVAWNTGSVVSPQTFKEIFIPHLKKFAAEVKLPWAFHSCGDVSLLFDDFMTLGFNAFNPFQPPVMDINAMHDRYGGEICFWGNIDLTYTLSDGTTAEVEAEVKQRIAKLAPNGGYILSTANSIIDSCKTENILAMIAAAKKYGKYPISV
jgi:uroporphyrinogen decarboxylase